MEINYSALQKYSYWAVFFLFCHITKANINVFYVTVQDNDTGQGFGCGEV